VLVLTRKVGEAIVIDGGIRIEVVAAQGGTVRLGVTAPKHLRVDREELHARPQANVEDIEPPLSVG
jgi:carbon storage regulator